MWFRGPDADIAWFILIFVIVSLGAILGKFYILNKKKQCDESAKADLKASKTFIVICILTLILVPLGIIMYDNYIYQAKDIIDRADGQVKQADSKSNTIKKLLEIAGRLGRSAETAEEAKKLEEISKKLRGPKNNKNLTKEDIALLDKYRSELNPKFKPAPAPVIKTAPDLLKANKEISGWTTEISPDVAKKIESKEFVLMPGLEYVPAKNGKPASIDWDGKTMNTGVIYDGKKYTETGTYRGEATPEELRSAGIEPTTPSAPAPERPAAKIEVPEPVAEPVTPKDPVPETAELPGVKNPQPEAPPPNPSATKTPARRPSRPQNVTTIPELIRDKAVSSLLGLRERLLSSVPKNFGDIKSGVQEYLENLGNPNSMPLQLYRKQKKLLKEQAGITPKPAKPVERPDVKPTRPEATPPKPTKPVEVSESKIEPGIDELKPNWFKALQSKLLGEVAPHTNPESPVKPKFSSIEAIFGKPRNTLFGWTTYKINPDQMDLLQNVTLPNGTRFRTRGDQIVLEVPTKELRGFEIESKTPRLRRNVDATEITKEPNEDLYQGRTFKPEDVFTKKPNAKIVKEKTVAENPTPSGGDNVQTSKPGTGPVPEGASAAGQASTTSNAGAQASTGNSAKTRGGIDWGANGEAAFQTLKGGVNALFNPITTAGKIIGAAGLTAAGLNEGANVVDKFSGKQPVSTANMFWHALLNPIDEQFGTHFSKPQVVTPHITGENAPATGEEQAGTETETAANEEQKQNKNPGTVVTSWLPESFKNISVNDYPVGGSLFGAIAGGALGAGFGGLNYILTDENELSEEEKKKRSLARAMLSSAGIGAGIGGAIGGLDDWGRSTANNAKTSTTV